MAHSLKCFLMLIFLIKLLIEFISIVYNLEDTSNSLIFNNLYLIY